MSKKRQPVAARKGKSHEEERDVDRSVVTLSDQDIEYITRAVATEVPEWINRRHPDVYRDMVAAVTDTITNRLVSGHYGKSIAEVLNQPSAFSVFMRMTILRKKINFNGRRSSLRH
jgi:spore germination cell wall hydrolase CwlJ-like protein